MVGGDLSNARYSPLTQINKQNIKRLGSAWISENFEEGGTSRATPVVTNGVMFVTAGRHVYALDAKTGKRMWVYRTVPGGEGNSVTATSQHRGRPKVPNAAPNLRGVGTGQGLVFVGLVDGNVIALNEKTGALEWMQQTGEDPSREGQKAATAPTYVNGVVLMGLSNGDANIRGRMTALDAGSGKIRWQVFSVPAPGEPGHETWPSFNDTWKAGGGGVWTNAAVDPELGLVYFATGNAVPILAGDWRPGDNLYTCSILALDLKTGKIRWHYQLVHHDVFDADAGTPVILYDAFVNGRVRKAIAAMRSDGYLFRFDRESGEPLTPIEERPVPQLKSEATSPTQPVPVGAERILMDCDDWKKEAIPAGFQLGCMWTPPASPPPSSDPPNVLAPWFSVRAQPMAFSPQTAYFYAMGTSMLHWPRRAQDPYFYEWADTPPDLKAYEEFAAIDSRTGKIAWKRREPAVPSGGFPHHATGGPLATAGNLVFRGLEDGAIEAFDATSGEQVWQMQTGMSGVTGSPISYQLDDEQYIAIPMSTAVWALKIGGAPPAMKRAAPKTLSSVGAEFSGPIVDTREIESTSLKRWGFGPGVHYFVDEYAVNPYRARVETGATVRFANNGVMSHEFSALDGSWTTGRMSPAQTVRLTFDRPGQYPYRCKEHPWVYGEIIVTEPPQLRTQPSGAATSGTKDGSKIGKAQYSKHCGLCHGDGLEGRGEVPALQGRAFMLRWGSRTVGDLFERIRTTMPQAAPASLDKRTYVEIVAHVMKANGVELDTSAEHDDLSSWNNIRIGLQKGLDHHH